MSSIGSLLSGGLMTSRARNQTYTTSLKQGICGQELAIPVAGRWLFGFRSAGVRMLAGALFAILLRRHARPPLEGAVKRPCIGEAESVSRLLDRAAGVAAPLGIHVGSG